MRIADYLSPSRRVPLLDLCCGAGLAADGYAAVGFEPTGVDLHEQPRYPYSFRQLDLLRVLGTTAPRGFAAIHVSPPCQLFTIAANLRTAQGSQSKEKLDLLTPTLEALRAHFNDIPWVVENVEQARELMVPEPGEHLARLCGSSFGLGVQRHRLFLSNVPLRSSKCDHSRFEVDPESGKPRPWGVYHVPGDSIPSGGRTARDLQHGCQVMGVAEHRRGAGLTWDELKEGFPSHYASHVGADLLRAIGA